MDKAKIIQRASDYLAQETDSFFCEQVQALLTAEDFDELNDRFYTDLEFGTGGMRGIIGGGYNRMNPLTVRQATQGLADYVVKHAGKDSLWSAVIAFDSRHYSDTFALAAALVLAANGIKTYLFPALRSTPQLSFTVRHLKADCGLVITASHNPSQYNGYKVYWNDGAQVVHPQDKGITERVRAVKSINTISREAAERKGLLVILGQAEDAAFFAAMKAAALRTELLNTQGKNLKIVYTPLHGTGAYPVHTVLEQLGIELKIVPEQEDPDGDFPTVKFPNPEEAAAMKMALDLARQEKADLVMGSDPDADRLGIAVPASPMQPDSAYRLLTGNQLGVLLVDYIFASLNELGRLPAVPVHVKTIVTTELQRVITEKYGGICIDTLTGFKFIGEQIRLMENGTFKVPARYAAQFVGRGNPQYVFGTEESYGYLVHTLVRDKDAVSTALLTVEMALYYRLKNQTLLSRLEEIYREYGYYQELLFSQYFEGQEGFSTMQNLMSKLRDHPPGQWAGSEIVVLRDFLKQEERDLSTGRTVDLPDLPVSNVLQFILQDGSVISVRPSGTEPKIKFYASCNSKVSGDLELVKSRVEGKIQQIKKEILQFLAQPA